MYLKINIYEEKPMKMHKYEEKRLAFFPQNSAIQKHIKRHVLTFITTAGKKITNLYFPTHNSFHLLTEKMK